MRRAVVQLLSLLVMFGLPGVALAHTELDYSEPAAGASVDEPVSEVVIAFTLPVTIVGNGFEVLDPSGGITRPTVETDGDRVFTLVMSEPLAGGEVGVRYEVAAEDGHVLAEGFSFTVTAAAASTTTTSAAVTSATASDTTTTTTAVTTPIEVTTSTEQPEESSGSTWLWLVGAGLLAGVGIGLFLSLRSRSDQ